MSVKYCNVCGSEMSLGLLDWHRKCSKCSYECAEFQPAINDNGAHQNIDEQFRETGLRSLRIENFDCLLKAIKANGKKSGKLLDVGCAHGWFLEAATENGFEAFGIEPDLKVYNSTIKRKLSVRQGFFPEILSDNERYDVIIFNDVFEHIPDLESVLSGCASHLMSDGFLVLNLPSSKGIFYIISCFLSRFGFNKFFERLWQKDLPSPHLHYFNKNNLDKLLQKNGFEPISSGTLSTLRLKGLFTRISYTGHHTLPMRLLIYFLLVISLPVLSILPSDIIYTIARKNRN